MSDAVYACCHVTEFPLQAMLRMRPALRGLAVAVLQGEAPLEKVCACNQPASQMGVHAGMTRAQMDTLSSVHRLHRSLIEERSAAAALLDCMSAFSPRIEDMSRDGVCTLVADIAGTERLLGPPAVVIQSMLQQAGLLGITANVAVSGNLHTALCMARFGRTLVVEHQREKEALAALPVDTLEPSTQHRETLANWGIATLGDLAGLSPQSLVARLGQEGKRLHQLACGAYPHLFQPVDISPTYEEVVEFDSAVDLLDPLLFVLQPMLDQLLKRAQMYARAIEKTILILRLEGGAMHEIRVRTALPSEDKSLLLKLLQLEMQANPPSAPVLQMRLYADTAATKKVQLGLFSPQLPESSRLDVTLARLRAIVGEDRVGSPVLGDTHRDDSFHVEPFDVGGKERATKPGETRAVMRQLRPAETVRVSVGKAALEYVYFRGERYSVLRAYGPWHSSGAWWSSHAWSVEQWDVIATGDASGRYLACCLVRDGLDGSWKLVGMYD